MTDDPAHPLDDLDAGLLFASTASTVRARFAASSRVLSPWRRMNLRVDELARSADERLLVVRRVRPESIFMSYVDRGGTDRAVLEIYYCDEFIGDIGWLDNSYAWDKPREFVRRYEAGDPRSIAEWILADVERRAVGPRSPRRADRPAGE